MGGDTGGGDTGGGDTGDTGDTQPGDGDGAHGVVLFPLFPSVFPSARNARLTRLSGVLPLACCFHPGWSIRRLPAARAVRTVRNCTHPARAAGVPEAPCAVRRDGPERLVGGAHRHVKRCCCYCYCHCCWHAARGAPCGHPAIRLHSPPRSGSAPPLPRAAMGFLPEGRGAASAPP